MTGAGVVLPHEDAKDFDDLRDTLVREMKPKNTLARDCLGHLALLMLKLKRGAFHEAKSLDHRMRHAEAEFDQQRLGEADHLYSWIAAEPATNSRRLRRSPEGIDRLIAAIQGLLDDLCRPAGMRWDWFHCDRLHHLLGLRREELPVSRFRAMSEAIQGDFKNLDPHDGEGQMDGNRSWWALQMLAQLIAAEIAKLKVLREGLDLEDLALDRAEAKYRAMFDDSKAGILARKYNAANERSYFRTLKEFRQLNAEATEVFDPPPVAPDPPEELGSFSPEPPEEELAKADVDPIVVDAAKPAVVVAAMPMIYPENPAYAPILPWKPNV